MLKFPTVLCFLYPMILSRLWQWRSRPLFILYHNGVKTSNHVPRTPRPEVRRLSPWRLDDMSTNSHTHVESLTNLGIPPKHWTTHGSVDSPEGRPVANPRSVTPSLVSYRTPVGPRFGTPNGHRHSPTPLRPWFSLLPSTPDLGGRRRRPPYDCLYPLILPSGKKRGQ